jgi:hypothetical protein
MFILILFRHLILAVLLFLAAAWLFLRFYRPARAWRVHSGIWLFLLPCRLLFLTFLVVVLLLLLGAVLIRTHIGALFNFPLLIFLLAFGLLAGLWTVFTWSLHRDTPFFSSLPPRSRRRLSAAIMFLPALAATFGLLQFLCVNLQPFGSPGLARFPSPAHPADQIWIYNDSWLDTDFPVFARPRGQKVQSLGTYPVGDPFPCLFTRAQWTADGQLFVCFIAVSNVASQGPDHITAQPLTPQPVPLVAFDFSTGRLLQPVHFDYNSPGLNWQDTVASLEKLIAAHGGLAPRVIDANAIRQTEKPPWFWQTLAFSQSGI